MLDENVSTNIPVIFQKIKNYEESIEDTRFLKVKIWLMHTEENYNGSYFSKEVVENSIGSLANTPILAYIEQTEDGKDFSDHRMVLVKENDDIKIKYIGQAIGVIPEDNNAQFEMRVCDDGIEREFLTVEGLVWKKWDDPIDIFEDADGVKSQSMELHDDFEGYWDNGLYNFTKFKFFGACALGEDVFPAMHSSTIEAQFAENNIFDEINSKMELFKSYAKEKGGNQKLDEKIELLKKYSFTEDYLKAEGIDYEKISLEDLESKLKSFSYGAKQLRKNLRAKLFKETVESEYGYEYSPYWYIDHTDSLVIAEDYAQGDTLVGLSYTVQDNKIEIDFNSKKSVKVSYELIDDDVESHFRISSTDRLEHEKEKFKKDDSEAHALQTNFENLTKDYDSLKKENEGLKQFKSETLTAQREQAEKDLFSRFKEELTDEEINAVQDNSSKYTLDDLEDKLFALVGKKKSSFSKKNNDTVKVGIEKEETNDSPYGGYFEKYNK